MHHGLKSDTKHPYMKKVHPFWRYVRKGFYSDEVIEFFERRKVEFESNCKYIQWQSKLTEN